MERNRLPRFSYVVDLALPWQERVDSLKTLNKEDLSPDDLEELYGFLSYSPVHGNIENWYVVINEVMDVLRRADGGADGFINAMCDVIKDPNADLIVRDYAIQHLASACLPMSEQSGLSTINNPQQLQTILSTFEEVIKDPVLLESSIPGTTLSLLVVMRDEKVLPDSLSTTIQALTPWLATAIHDQESSHTITRISAINAVGDFQLSELTPEIRSFAYSESSDTAIRLNAIAALGQLGELSDQTTLQELASSSTIYRFAAQSALKNLNNSLQYNSK